MLSRIVTARCDIALFLKANVKKTKVLSNRTCSLSRTCGKLNKEILRIIFQIVMDLNSKSFNSNIYHAPRKGISYSSKGCLVHTWCTIRACTKFFETCQNQQKKICIVKINTFVMALMFILRELKNIRSGE